MFKSLVLRLLKAETRFSFGAILWGFVIDCMALGQAFLNIM